MLKAVHGQDAGGRENAAAVLFPAGQKTMVLEDCYGGEREEELRRKCSFCYLLVLNTSHLWKNVFPLIKPYGPVILNGFFRCSPISNFILAKQDATLATALQCMPL